MQRGSLALVSRKEGTEVWEFRWSEKNMHGARVQRKRVIGTVEHYPNEAAARSAMTIILAELNSGKTSCRAALKSRISPLRPIFWHLDRALLPWFSP
jgi:hypothetical protein